MIRVKICGIRTPEHAVACVQHGADLLGLVLAPSRRQVTPEQAQAIAAAARAAAAARGQAVELVGVFVNEPRDHVEALVAAIGLDWAQLSGHEELRPGAVPDGNVVKAVRFDGHASEALWLEQAERYPLLVDAHVPGSFGGAGVTGDWERAAELARRGSVWLAGGLNLDNVAAAVQQVRPAVVDVSSGVETDGTKDITKIEAFIRAAKAAAPQTDDAPEYQSTHSL